MAADLQWADSFSLDIKYGYIGGDRAGSGQYAPRMVLNDGGSTVEHAIIEELKRCRSFTFSVAFISSGAIAQLKQHLIDFRGNGRIITSDFLGFNEPRAFAELLNLQELLGIEVRRHTAKGFHPKGYVFEKHQCVTAMIGSSNLTNRALSQNHEWNLKVSAASGSDLAQQLIRLLDEQTASSEPLTQEWIDDYSTTYIASLKPSRDRTDPTGAEREIEEIRPNSMQQDALRALDLVRVEGARKAIIISATGTGKTMLSALDVKAADPRRLLFIVHREQILDRTIKEYQRVLKGAANEYGKLTGTHKQADRRYVFATVQTLSQESVLAGLPTESFDYIVIDEAHRSAAATYLRIMQHFEPKFLLGMTATPERTDGFNVFELFDYNVPYEIRLNHALEAEILCPFHYYGVADITFEDGTTTEDATQLSRLVSSDRIDHLLKAIERFGQVAVPTRGLIFCSRKDEARDLSAGLNRCKLRGRSLRTVALTGEDSIEERERRVTELEEGRLDYILTVDVFNEGVDIPSVNQVIMLRQTQSAIVFVQQLGRGLRLAQGKDYLVVIDFIGNYNNNFLIPIALFGDESLNRESLRERLNETVEAGALPGLSSVSFDEISRERILRSISQTKLDSMTNLKAALVSMKNRVGRTPTLWDFWRFESVDPILLATKKEHYPALASSLLNAPLGLSTEESRAMSLLSQEVLAGKRLQELILLEYLLESNFATLPKIASVFESSGLTAGSIEVRSSIDTLALRGYPQVTKTRFVEGVIEVDGDTIRLADAFRRAYSTNETFRNAVHDILKTGKALTERRYLSDRPFTPGMQYTRVDAAHILGWPRAVGSTIYGYKTDVGIKVCAIFVTLEKSDEIAASTDYKDQLLDRTTMRWFTRSNRTMTSTEVAPIINGLVDLHVFVKKDDADGGDHYYLGKASAQDPENTSMPGNGGTPLPVVKMLLRFDQPITQGLFDYFHPLNA